MGYAGCDLTCEIESLHGEFPDLSGTVCVQDNGAGIIFSGELQGLLSSTSGGFHIHSGDSCSSNQGGHYWSGDPAGSISTCPIADDPWVGAYGAVWNSDASGNASPYNVNPGLKVGAIPFTIGTNDSQCGVTGHTVIVHKGCPANSDDPCDPGVRIGCCVLA